MKIHAQLSITIAFISGLAVASPALAQSEDVKFAANIEFIKGHLKKAVTNKLALNQTSPKKQRIDGKGRNGHECKSQQRIDEGRSAAEIESYVNGIKLIWKLKGR